MKKILCVMSDAGGAHRTVSNAIRDALHRSYSPSEFTYEMVDVFATSKFCNYFIRSYSRLTRFSPITYGNVYRFANHAFIWNSIYHIMIQPFIKEKIKRLILEKKPDIILSIFALSGRLMMDILEELELADDIPVIIVVIDPFTIHFSWAEPRAALIIVPTEEAKDQLIEYGVPEDRLMVNELPINPRFYESYPAEDLKNEIDWVNGKFNIMLMGGGDGTGGMYRTVDILVKSNLDTQLIVIAGRNKKLEDKLNKLKDESKVPVKVFGYTDKIPELMSLSDILVTKAGPMTIMEAISKELPLIITGFIPGQEEGNVEYIRSNKLGYVVNKKSEIVEIVRNAINNGSELESIKANLKEHQKVLGAQKIAEMIIDGRFHN
jgi:1,2-diacylglycerol 3-beta-galactosyltransferase